MLLIVEPGRRYYEVSVDGNTLIAVKGKKRKGPMFILSKRI